MTLLQAILTGLALLSLGLTLWQWWVARRFPLHQRPADRSYAPAVTLLKPLKGCDAETRACLESWLRQDYAGPVEVLFGVASPEDPVCDLVRALLREHPQADARLVVCGESLGPNAKVSTLIQIERLVRHEVVVVSDADVRVPADFLSSLVQPLREPGTGLVHCFYQLANPVTTAMRWEAVAVNADFWSQVLQARSLRPVDFALGAVMAITRPWLAKIGGFASLVDYLADDYQLGNRIARAGGRIEFCPVVVACYEPVSGWRQVWGHQLRWARTIRVCQPAPFFFSILSNGSLWPLLAVLGGWSGGVWGGLVGMAALLVRGAVALDLQRRLTRQPVCVCGLWLPWAKDLLGGGIWAMAFLGSHITWRGRRFRLLPGGRLEPEARGEAG